MTCYAKNQNSRTACGTYQDWRQGPQWTTAVHQVTCRQCLDALRIKHVGSEGIFFKQDNPQMQAVAILSGLKGHIMTMDLGIPTSEKAIKNIQFLISQLEKLHDNYLPDGW